MSAISPESAADTVNLVVSPQTTISGAQGYKEQTYRLISPFNLDFKLVTPPTFLVWPMAQGWTHFPKVLWRSKQLAASGGFESAWPTCELWSRFVQSGNMLLHRALCWCRYNNYLLYSMRVDVEVCYSHLIAFNRREDAQTHRPLTQCKPSQGEINHKKAW